jgi:hypothetical protein
MAMLPELHRNAGMSPEEVGLKVLDGIRRNAFYIFSHPEFRDEVSEVFDEVLSEFPDEPPSPDRLAFEDGRRAGKAAAMATWQEV